MPKLYPMPWAITSRWGGIFEKNISAVWVEMGAQVWYHGCMTNVHHNNEEEHFPCDCHSPQYAYTDSLCPMCEELREKEREAKAQKEREEQDRQEAEADMRAFADAAESMSREDWDADNDWLASAGWGEM